MTDLETQQQQPDLFSAEDTTGYYEGMDAGAFAVPFLTILQGLSPAVQRGTPGFLEGAAAGLILNTVTKKISESVLLSVLRRTHTLCYWVPREKGGGFIREEEATPTNMSWFAQIALDDKKRRIVSERGTEIEVTEHRNFQCALIGEDNKLEPAMVSMTKSQLTVARQWNTNIDVHSAKVPVTVGGQTALRPVLHSGKWRLSTTLKTKDSNNWYVWAFAFAGLHTQKALVQEVRERVEAAKTVVINRALEQAPVEPEEATGAEM
jgi:hypothetical protein